MVMIKESIICCYQLNLLISSSYSRQEANRKSISMTVSSIVAVFDFDNTLTDRDSLLPFLFCIQGIWKTSCHLALLGLDFARFLVGNLSRQGVKEKIFTRFIGGWRFADVQALGQRYADQQLDRYLRPEALERLAWHQAQGHRCLLVSASLDFYLKPWAMRHGFEAVLSSSLEITPDGYVTGRLVGLNCWGPEKARRLLAYLGSKENYQLYVYGDSRGDREILALADYPFYRTFR
jgi:HAD superfamily hydrolase (TIGR01490 family)